MYINFMCSSKSRREELLLLWALVFLPFNIFYMQNNLYKTLKVRKNKSSLRNVHVHVEINVYNNICQLSNSYYDHICYSRRTEPHLITWGPEESQGGHCGKLYPGMSVHPMSLL